MVCYSIPNKSYFFNIILFIQHKSRPAFLPNGFSIPFISQPTAHPGYPPAAAGNPLYRNAAAWQCTARFYRIALLPLEIDLAHGDFPLLQPVIQAHKIAFAVCQTGRNACRHTRNVNRNTGRSHDRQKTIRGDQRHQCRTERNHHVYANRRLSCVSAAPDRSFEYFPAYASPFRIKAIAQTIDTASLGRSVCRCRPLRAYRIPSRKHGIPSGLRFPPET